MSSAPSTLVCEHKRSAIFHNEYFFDESVTSNEGNPRWMSLYSMGITQGSRTVQQGEPTGGCRFATDCDDLRIAHGRAALIATHKEHVGLQPLSSQSFDAQLIEHLSPDTIAPAVARHNRIGRSHREDAGRARMRVIECNN
jgi:hypothetical protein